MTRLWAKREDHIRIAIEADAGMHYDLQIIAAKALQEIDGPDVETLEAQ